MGCVKYIPSQLYVPTLDGTIGPAVSPPIETYTYLMGKKQGTYLKNLNSGLSFTDGR